MLLYLVLYAVMRSINEVFRGDVERGFLLEAQLGQVISTSKVEATLMIINAAGSVYGFALFVQFSFGRYTFPNPHFVHEYPYRSR